MVPQNGVPLLDGGGGQIGRSQSPTPLKCSNPKVIVSIEPPYGDFQCVCHRYRSKSTLRDGGKITVESCGVDNCTVPHLAINVLNCLGKPVAVREAKMVWKPSVGGLANDVLVTFDSSARIQNGERWTSGLMSAPANGAGEIETVVTIEDADGALLQERGNEFHVRGVFTTVED
jgi:hypothetical protein